MEMAMKRQGLLSETGRNSSRGGGDREKIVGGRKTYQEQSRRKTCHRKQTPHLHALLCGLPLVINVAEIEWLKCKRIFLDDKPYKPREKYSIYSATTQAIRDNENENKKNESAEKRESSSVSKHSLPLHGNSEKPEEEVELKALSENQSSPWKEEGYRRMKGDHLPEKLTADQSKIEISSKDNNNRRVSVNEETSKDQESESGRNGSILSMVSQDPEQISLKTRLEESQNIPLNPPTTQMRKCILMQGVQTSPETITKEQLDAVNDKMSKLELELRELKQSILSKDLQSQNSFEMVRMELLKISECLPTFLKNSHYGNSLGRHRRGKSWGKKASLEKDDTTFSLDSDSNSELRLTESTYHQVRRKLSDIRSALPRLKRGKIESMNKDLSAMSSEMKNLNEATKCNVRNPEEQPSNKWKKNGKGSKTKIFERNEEGINHDWNKRRNEEKRDLQAYSCHEHTLNIRNSEQKKINERHVPLRPLTKEVQKKLVEGKFLVLDRPWRQDVDCVLSPSSVYEPSSQSLSRAPQSGGLVKWKKDSPRLTSKSSHISCKPHSFKVKGRKEDLRGGSRDEEARTKKKKRSGRKKARDGNHSSSMIVLRLSVSGEEPKCQTCCQTLPK